MYNDNNERSINIVMNDEIKSLSLIKLQGWIPLNLCSTSSGDFLVTMITDDKKQSKVVRYFGSTDSGEPTPDWASSPSPRKKTKDKQPVTNKQFSLQHFAISYTVYYSVPKNPKIYSTCLTK